MKFDFSEEKNKRIFQTRGVSFYQAIEAIAEKGIIEDLENMDVGKIEKPTRKEQAAKEGLKYQSFIESILHKYICRKTYCLVHGVCGIGVSEEHLPVFHGDDTMT